jgi:RND family efflux transporter MFP subunit
MTLSNDTIPESTPPRSFARRLFGTLIRLAFPILIIGGGVAGYFYYSGEQEEAKSPSAKKQIIRTRVIELESQDYSVSVTTQGIVQSHNEITLSGQVSGQITYLSPNLEVGAYFSKDDVLIKLDDRDYTSALKAVEARLQSVKSALKLAQVDHTRTTRGNADRSFSVVTEAEVDQSAAVLAQAEANVNLTTIQVEQAQLNLDRTQIRAPFDGRVREKLVGLGQSLNAGGDAAVIFAIDYAEVRLPISAKERQYLNLPEMDGDTPISVVLRDAISLESTQTWTAQILRTEGMLDVDSLELFAIARIDDPFGIQSGLPLLRIGQPITGSINGKVLTDVVKLPRGAVRQLDQIILIDKENLTLSNLMITPIWSDEDFIIVRDPNVQAGSLLATTHIVYAPDGAKIEVIPDVVEEDDKTSDDVETKT